MHINSIIREMTDIELQFNNIKGKMVSASASNGNLIYPN
jgi:hypothetical protein